MPIHDEEIQVDEFLILPASATVADAAEAVRDAGGGGVWRLLIDLGGYEFAQFKDGTFAALGDVMQKAPDRKAFFLQELGSLDLFDVEVVEQDEVTLYEVEDMMEDSEAGTVVILREDEVFGIVAEPSDRGSVASFALVDAYEEAGGKAVFSKEKKDEDGKKEDKEKKN